MGVVCTCHFLIFFFVAGCTAGWPGGICVAPQRIAHQPRSPLYTRESNNCQIIIKFVLLYAEHAQCLHCVFLAYSLENELATTPDGQPPCQ